MCIRDSSQVKVKLSTIDNEVKDGIATILLNRPDHLNAVNTTMTKELPKAWKLFNEDNSAIVAILSNHGTNSFCAGADLDDLPDMDGDIGKSTIVIIPEWKEAKNDSFSNGLNLHTVHIQRGNPTVQDPLWNSLSKLNCISACIQAEKAGADEALMLNPNGFISTCNSTHFFIIRNQELWTSNGLYCIEGITRGNIISLAKKLGLLVKECDFSLTKAYSADEAFVTGTFAGLIPVNSIDGRRIGNFLPGLITKRLIKAYNCLLYTSPSPRDRTRSRMPSSA